MKRICKIVLAAPSAIWFNVRPWNIIPYTLALMRAVIPLVAQRASLPETS